MRRLLVLALALAGCAQLSEEMSTIEAGYREARYEDVVVFLDDIEPDVPDMDPPMRARFYYLRGMSAHRLGKHDDALHYLALAREVAGTEGRGLRDPWKAQLTETLAALTPTRATHHARDPGQAPSSGSETPLAPAGSGVDSQEAAEAPTPSTAP